MVSKLSFKSDKKRTKHGIATKKKKEDALEKISYHINNEKTCLYDVDLSLVETGWTNASLVEDLNGPLVLIYSSEESSTQCLSVEPLGRLGLSDDLDYLPPDNSIVFTEENKLLDLKEEVYNCEPKKVNQVLVAVSLDHLLNKEDRVIDEGVRLALKTSDSKYLSYKPETGDIMCDSETLTTQEFFNFKKVSIEGAVRWEISVGEPSEKNKLVVIESEKGAHFKVIQDEEDLLNDLNQFNVRTQTPNSLMGRRIISDICSQSGLDDIGREKQWVDKISKLGISITERTRQDLKAAIENGHVNEFMIDLKEKHSSDSRC